ncbi:MAG: YncE family protein, partial [Actinobacteria bacterium]|nr:YncE family protein [Actinomycetota bacterium]
MVRRTVLAKLAVIATAFAILSVMTLPELASAITPSQTAVTSITVGTNPRGVAVSPDGSSVWVTNDGGTSISRINTTTNNVTSITVGTSPRGVAVSPDGSSVWVTNFDGTTVSRINTATNNVTSITVGTSPRDFDGQHGDANHPSRSAGLSP